MRKLQMKTGCGNGLDQQTQPRGHTIAVRHSQVTLLDLENESKHIKPLADECQNRRDGTLPNGKVHYDFLTVIGLE